MATFLMKNKLPLPLSYLNAKKNVFLSFRSIRRGFNPQPPYDNKFIRHLDQCLKKKGGFFLLSGAYGGGIFYTQ